VVVVPGVLRPERAAPTTRSIADARIDDVVHFRRRLRRRRWRSLSSITSSSFVANIIDE
jgi:hypothetical protein